MELMRAVCMLPWASALCMLSWMFSCLVSCTGAATVGGVDRCGTFSTWSRPEMRNNCTSFSGCLTPNDRSTYLNPHSPHIPCGFMQPNDLDIIRNHFSADRSCRIVVYTAIIYAYDKINNPNNMETIAKDVCFVLITDRKTMQNADLLLDDVMLNESSPWLVFMLRNPPDPNPGKSTKMIKLAGPTLFPNAEWIIYVDAKGHVLSIPYDFMELIDAEVSNNPNLIHLGMSHNPQPGNFPLRSAYTTIGRLKEIDEEGKDSHIDQNLAELRAQMAEYERDGFYAEAGRELGNMINAYVLIFRNTNCVKRFFCAWSDECMVYSHREQVSHHYVQLRLSMRGVYIEVDDMARHFEIVPHFNIHIYTKFKKARLTPKSALSSSGVLELEYPKHILCSIATDGDV